MATAFTRSGDLLRFLDLRPESLPEPLLDELAFPIRVPRSYAELMQPGDPWDPLLRQVLPVAAEGRPALGFTADPLGEASAGGAPGLLQRYHGRALLLVTGACAVHCRFCFRRHLRDDLAAPGAELGNALERIAAQPSVREVILSGGDPLLLDDARLADLIARLEAIPHLSRLRLHSRVPVVLPARIGPDLCRILSETRLQAVLVVHANHAQELGAAARAALEALRQHRLPALSQTVLLRGINDSAEGLAQLTDTLFACGVLPYYLHLLDRVHGAAHFEVSQGRALRIIAELRCRSPGYLVPRLVRDEPGRAAKTMLA